MAGKLNVKWPNIPVVIQQLEMGYKDEGEIARTFNMIGQQVTEMQSNATPVDTGLLESSNTYSVGDKELIIENKTGYAPYVEFGTGFMGKGSPAEYFPPELTWSYGEHIKGVIARPFFYPAILNASAQIDKDMISLSERWARRVIRLKG